MHRIFCTLFLFSCWTVFGLTTSIIQVEPSQPQQQEGSRNDPVTGHVIANQLRTLLNETWTRFNGELNELESHFDGSLPKNSSNSPPISMGTKSNQEIWRPRRILGGNSTVDTLTENIYEGVMEALEKIDVIQQRLEEESAAAAWNSGKGLMVMWLQSLENSILDQNRLIKSVQTRLQNMEQNPVPMGFIYTQYPEEAGPTEIWPNVEWTEVTSSYAGLFFRAAGGQAASPTVAQDDNSPRIDHIKYTWCNTGDCIEPETTVVPKTQEWSPTISTGVYKKKEQNDPNVGWDSVTYMAFHSTGGEVRPRNRAIRIFKRTA